MSSVIDRISQDLKLDKEYVRDIISRSNHYYKDYKIPKSTGGTRSISHPSPELKTFQYWIVNNILSLLSISDGSFAYSKGNSTKKHATYHSNANYIFHTDIRSFFPSIHSKMLIPRIKLIRPKLESKGIWYDDLCDNIVKICFRRDTLCIGAVSSPIISNAIMYLFDEKMRKYCKKRKFLYSRYADDIYISSTAYIDPQIAKDVSEELRKHGFQMNTDKTWFRSKKYRRRITGLIITNDGNVTIGTKMRKRIKKMVYEKIIHDRGDSNEILGYLSYLKNIEPYVYSRIIVKYSTYCSGDIIEAIKK